MYPEILRIGDFAFTSFGLLLVLSFVGSYLQLSWGLRRTGIGDEEDASALVFAAGVAGIVGSKVYFAILKGDLQYLWSRSGLVWYGGFILGALAVLWVMRRRRLPAWQTADAAAPALALGYAIGRVGCFLVGDDYGRPTDLPWGVEFPEGLPPTTAGVLRDLGVEVPATVADGEVLAVHPTQLYETAMALVIWWVGRSLLQRGVRPGTTALVVLGLLAVERFLVEILRAKDDRFFGPFTVAQALSVLVIGLLALLWSRRPRARLHPGTTSATP